MRAIALSVSIFTVLSLLSAPVLAQSRAQEEELQRCVWRCLAGSPGAASRQYNQCVRRMCSPGAPDSIVGGGSGGAASRSQSEVWTTGALPGGQGRFANIDDAETGRAMAYLCSRNGQSEIVLDRGMSGNGGRLLLQVDGRAHRLDFRRGQGALRAQVPPRAPVLSALTGGRAARLAEPGGRRIADFSLSGSGRALRSVLGYCFGG